MIDQYSFHFEKGIADFQQKNYAPALRSFSKCIQLDPKSKSSYLNHGVICNIKRIYQVAYEDFTFVIEYDPWELIAYYNRFISLMSLRKYAQALNDLLISLSLGYVKLGVIKNNIDIIEKGIKLVQNNTQAYLAKSILLYQKDKYQQALKAIQLAINFYPQYRLGLNQRAAIYRKLNKYQQSEQDIKYLLELSHQQQIHFSLKANNTNLSIKQLIKQIQIRHDQFIKLRDEIFNNKKNCQKKVSVKLQVPEFQVLADILNLPSLNTNSLIQGELQKSVSFDKQNFKKQKLMKQLPKFVQNNYSGATDRSDNTLKQILSNKSDFQSMKTYKSKAEFDSIYEESENTQKQIQNINQNNNCSVENIENKVGALTAINLSTNPNQTKQSIIIQQNRSLELNSQFSSQVQGSSSRRSKIEYTDLQIQISAATLIRSTQLIGSMSPYCQVRYANQVKKTSVSYYSGKNPVWNQVLKFKILDSRALITIKLYDKQFFKKDDIIGQTVITMYEQSNVLELKYEGKSIGNLFVKMRLI